jgi:hypothetical protein
MATQKRKRHRPIDKVLDDLEALPVSTDPAANVKLLRQLQRLGGELEGRDRDQLPPRAAFVLLELVDRMVPEGGYPEGAPQGVRQADHDAVLDCIALFAEDAHQNPAYFEALLDLVRRHPTFWSADRLIAELLRRYPGFERRRGRSLGR